jgi:hypothetical protein
VRRLPDRGPFGPDATAHQQFRAAVAARSAASRLRRSAVDGRLPATAAMPAATAPPAGGAVYHVQVSGYVQAAAGGPWTRLRTRAWSFTTV